MSATQAGTPRFVWREDVRGKWRMWAEFVRIVRMHRVERGER